jgi:hypothetical protein
MTPAKRDRRSASNNEIRELISLSYGTPAEAQSPAGRSTRRSGRVSPGDAAEHDQGGGVGDDFGLDSRVVLVVDSEGVDRLVAAAIEAA